MACSPQRFASDSASQKFRRDTSFRHFQDQFLTTNKKKNGPVFRKVYVFDVSRAVGIAIQCH